MFSTEKMTTVELDPQFVQSVKLLHSSSKDSADQLRNLIDQVIRQKYGSSKMLSNVLPKKFMVEETTVIEHSSKKKSSSSSSSKHSSKSSKSESPLTILHDDTPEILPADDTLALDDLTCVMCKGMDVSARNQLVECTECHSLYHQECHVPHISDSQIDVPRSVWYCSKCTKDTPPPVKEKERTSPKPIVESKSSKDSKKSSKSKTSKSQKSSSKKTK